MSEGKVDTSPELQQLEEQIRAEEAKAAPQETQVLVADPQEPTSEQPRDEQGRFTKPQAEQAEAESAQAEETVYTKEVDFGDGNTVTFEGSSPEEVLDKISKAYTAAVRKNKQAKAAPIEKQPVKRKELTADDEFMLDQEFINGKPTTAMVKAFEAKFGVSPDEMQEVVENFREQKRFRIAQSATQEFLQAHPEYMPDEQNKKLIGNYLLRFKMEPTLENMESAYEDLSDAGLLVTERKQQAAPTVKKKQTTGGFGLSGTPTSRSLGTKTPSQAELDRMSSDQLQDYLNSLE